MLFTEAEVEEEEADDLLIDTVTEAAATAAADGGSGILNMALMSESPAFLFDSITSANSRVVSANYQQPSRAVAIILGPLVIALYTFGDVSVACSEMG